MNVLVLTDLSRVAKNAGTYAVQFLADVPAHFYLLNIKLFHPEHPPEFPENHPRDLAINLLQQRVLELQELSTCKEHKFSVLYSENDLVGAARKFVLEKNIDLIVMGAANKLHSPNTIIGNHTFEVITKVKCNILAVAENSRYRTPRRMLFPIDYGVSLPQENLKFLQRPQIANNAGITVMEVGYETRPESGGSVNLFFEPLQDRQIETRKIPIAEAFSEEQLEALQQEFDLIVLLGKNINICSELLHKEKGLYARVTNELPILVLHQ
ncbi:Nucleotide-binding universal stress protein, UspA family [Salinimicrobium catena]|uniref:Nucleotide-binding universal stress protein, UspA family n=1 Tax=Salinimicrobium catena TaxID=390640 RepID=A0A1H5N2M8_9FLAO|nr:universal stress protein [Salinimicrobium catena]SDL35373.1 Nucleotide-binding universal stress protein, UspA family [Salinimicrobium catena]SEE95869.1 Nucleotide-binding universal stress protein, UspA family [Salinimicrobium catena]